MSSDARRLLGVTICGDAGVGKTGSLSSQTFVASRPVSCGRDCCESKGGSGRERLEGHAEIVVAVRTPLLDAAQLHDILVRTPLGGLDVLFIEMIARLTNETSMELGQDAPLPSLASAAATIRPRSFPTSVADADLVLLNKLDLLPHVQFDPRCSKTTSGGSISTFPCCTSRGASDRFGAMGGVARRSAWSHSEAARWRSGSSRRKCFSVEPPRGLTPHSRQQNSSRVEIVMFKKILVAVDETKVRRTWSMLRQGWRCSSAEIAHCSRHRSKPRVHPRTGGARRGLVVEPPQRRRGGPQWGGPERIPPEVKGGACSSKAIRAT